MQKQRFMIYNTIFQFSMFVLIAVVFAFSAKSVNAQMFDDAELYQDTAESSSVSESNKLEKKREMAKLEISFSRCCNLNPHLALL